MTDYVKKLRAKGWKATELAARWGITPRRISQIGKSPKQIHWDALAGLPNKSINWVIPKPARITEVRRIVEKALRNKDNRGE